MKFFPMLRYGASRERNKKSSKQCICNSFLKRLRFEPLEDRRLLTIGIGDCVWNDLNGNGLQDLE